MFNFLIYANAEKILMVAAHFIYVILCTLVSAQPNGHNFYCDLFGYFRFYDSLFLSPRIFVGQSFSNTQLDVHL